MSPYSLLFKWPVFVVSCFVSTSSLSCTWPALWSLASCPLTVYYSHGLFLPCAHFQFIIHMACFCRVVLCVLSNLSCTWPVFVVSCFMSVPVNQSHGLLCDLLLCVPFQLIIRMTRFVVSCFLSVPVYHSHDLFCGVLLCVPSNLSRTWPALWSLVSCLFQFIIHMA